MYIYEEFPKSRIKEIREECGCVKAHQTRMELLELIGQEKDQDDLKYIYSMLDEAEAELEACRKKAKAQLMAEVDAWNAEQDKKAEAERKKEHEKFEKLMEEAKEKFYASLSA